MMLDVNAVCGMVANIVGIPPYCGISSASEQVMLLQVHSNPAFHYDTPGPVSLKLTWNNLTVTYSGMSVTLRN